MKFPDFLQDKIDSLYAKIKTEKLTSVREKLTESYKNHTGTGQSHILSKNDSIVYAISRMPATYVVLRSLIEELFVDGFICAVKSVVDIGSGTGSGYFALKDFDSDLDIKLIEKSKDMISIFGSLVEDDVCVIEKDLQKIDEFERADMYIASYVLSEMTKQKRIELVKKLCSGAKKYILLVDAGTPDIYRQYMEIKELAISCGWNIVAPCQTEKCSLVDDYCQFYARVERSKLQKASKSAKLPYEDEKYFYLLLSKTKQEKNGSRIIRRPKIFENSINLSVCDCDGAKEILITKKQKNKFKLAKKAKINSLVDFTKE